MSEAKFNRLALEAGLDRMQEYVDHARGLLATHSPECNLPRSLSTNPSEKLLQELQKSKPESVVVQARAKRTPKDWCKGPAKFRTPEYLAKLKAVEEGLEAGMLGKALAKDYGISESTISAIRKRAELPPGTKWDVTQRHISRKDSSTRKDPALLKAAGSPQARGSARRHSPEYKAQLEAAEKDLMEGRRQSFIIKKYHLSSCAAQRLKKATDAKRASSTRPAFPRAVDIVLGMEPDGELNGSEGLCRCGAIIKIRRIQKYGGEMLSERVCGVCLKPVDFCTCPKILMPIPVAGPHGTATAPHA